MQVSSLFSDALKQGYTMRSRVTTTVPFDNKTDVMTVASPCTTAARQAPLGHVPWRPLVARQCWTGARIIWRPVYPEGLEYLQTRWRSVEGQGNPLAVCLTRNMQSGSTDAIVGCMRGLGCQIGPGGSANQMAQLDL